MWSGVSRSMIKRTRITMFHYYMNFDRLLLLLALHFGATKSQSITHPRPSLSLSPSLVRRPRYMMRNNSISICVHSLLTLLFRTSFKNKKKLLVFNAVPDVLMAPSSEIRIRIARNLFCTVPKSNANAKCKNNIQIIAHSASENHRRNLC